MPATPVLETERLRLRPHTRDDFPASVAMWSDPDVVRFIGGRPNTAMESWTRLLRYRGHWEVLDYGYWAVEERRSGLFVGEVGFADNKREMDPSFGDTPEAGWGFAPIVHGKGYATEAMTAALGWIETHFGAPRTVCMIASENSASFNVATKLGYREYARTKVAGRDNVLLERMRR